MSTLEEEREQARKLGRQINRNVWSHPNSPYAGKVVGILRGEVVIVAETLDEVAEALERWEPDPQRRYCIDANADDGTPHTSWVQSACRESRGRWSATVRLCRSSESRTPLDTRSHGRS